MAVRAAVSTFTDSVIPGGKGGGQTVIGAVQSGGDLTLASNTLNNGVIYLGGVAFVDETGPVKKLGILTFTPQNAFDIPLDTRIRGAGTGSLAVVNDVLQVGGADTWLRDAVNGVLAPTTPADKVSIANTLVSTAIGPILDVPLNTTAVGAASGKVMLVTQGGANYYLQLLSPAAGVPTAPSGLALSAITSSGMTLTWIDNSNNETGFKVERSTDNFGSVIVPITTTAANATTFTDSGLAAGTLYYYRVRATNVSGDSANTTAQATTASGPGDTFVRGSYPADLNGSTSSGGQTWTAVRSTWLVDTDGVGGGWAKLNSLGNLMAMATLSGQNASGDGTVQVTLTTDLSALPVQNTDCGVVLRLEGNSSTGRCWLLHAEVANGRYLLHDWTGSAYGSQSYVGSVTPAKGDVIQVVMSGTTITVNINGTQRINATSITQAWTSTGSHGLCCAANSGNSNIRWKAYSGPL